MGYTKSLSMKTLLTLMLCCVASWMFPQQSANARLDSLIGVAAKQQATTRFHTYCYISDEYASSDLDKALQYGRKALILAQNIKNDSCRALAYNSIANTFQYRSQPDSAIAYYRKSLRYRLQLHDSVGIADSYNNIGIVYDTKGDFQPALDNYFTALRYYDKKNDLAKMAMTFTNIGIVYKTHKDYKRALEYYQKAYDYYLKSGDVFGITVSSGNLGSILINFVRYKESIRYSEISLAGYKKLGYDRYLGYPLGNIAAVYDSLHQPVKAEEYYRESIGQHEKFENWYEVASTANAFSNFLIRKGRFSESINWSEKAHASALKSEAGLVVAEACNNLAKGYAGTGDFAKAYQYANQYIRGKDSLFQQEKTKAIFELDTKYQTEKKEKLLLRKEVEAKQRNLWLLILAFLVLTTLLAGGLLYRQQKLRIRQQQQEYQLEKAIARIETQNKLQEQRLSISRDLHDNIGAQLTFIISSVDNLKFAFDLNNTQSKLTDKLDHISQFTQSTIIELRDTIWAMNSDAITFEDLKLRIFNFIEKAKLAAGSIQFHFEIEDSVDSAPFSSLVGMNIYRTLQEAINNAIKYARASEIKVRIFESDGEIVLEARDNGIGFDTGTVPHGNGLHNMRKRMQSIGGNLDIASTMGQGTCVTIHIQASNLKNQQP